MVVGLRIRHESWLKVRRRLCSFNPVSRPILKRRSPESLTGYDDPDIPLLEQILGQKIKPIFRANMHPDVNPATGRKLPRPAGGIAGYQDHLEGQIWKEHPGITDVLGWCIQRIHVRG